MKLQHKITALVLSATAVIGCESLDQTPYESLTGDTALETVKDAQYWTNGFYSYLRGISYGRYILASETQSDLLNASIDYGNTYGGTHTWNMDATNNDATGYWENHYKALKNINHCIEKFATITPKDANETQDLNEFTGQAHAIRAYYFFRLTLRFCKSYDTSASSNLGIPLVLKYDTKAFPERATLEETFGQILDDISKAENLLATRQGSKGANQFTIDALKALKARVLLEKQDWAGAYQEATQLIQAGKYPLVNTSNDFKNIWHKDDVSETIMQLFASKDEAPNRNTIFLGYNTRARKYSPDYIPSQWVIDLYSDDDIRKNVYFQKKKVLLGATDYNAFLVNKYPGNPELYSGVTNYSHAPKLFRIAEQYLIAAEAAYKMGNETQALQYLNDLKTSRGLQPVTGKTGDELFQEIKDERLRELAFEGFRLDDLKRWQQNVKRHSPQSVEYITKSPAEQYHLLDKPHTHYTLVWPIPTRDAELNKNIKQNDGY